MFHFRGKFFKVIEFQKRGRADVFEFDGQVKRGHKKHHYQIAHDDAPEHWIEEKYRNIFFDPLGLVPISVPTDSAIKRLDRAIITLQTKAQAATKRGVKKSIKEDIAAIKSVLQALRPVSVNFILELTEEINNKS